MGSRGKQEDVKGEMSLMEGNSETGNQEEVTMAKKASNERSQTAITSAPITNEQRAAETCAKFRQYYEAPRKAFDAAEIALAEARVKCGEILFEDMFDNDTSRIGPKVYKPVYEVSYNLLRSIREFPLKSKTGIKNLVYLGYQSVWLQEQGVDLKKLMAEGKVGYTGLVRLAEMPYDERKLELLEVIAKRDKAFSVKELENEIRNRTKGKVEFPPDFEQVMAHGWMPLMIKEKIALITEGMEVEVGEETAEKVLRRFLADLKKVVEHGYDRDKGIRQSRGEELTAILRDAQKKAQDYMKYINAALRKIEEKNKDMKDMKDMKDKKNTA